jgi:hypothetical protein
MPNINKLTLLERCEQRFFERMQQRMGSNANAVEWVSYHIPKTAGTSFRVALQQAFGDDSFFGVYESSGANELSLGQQIWLPPKRSVIHGHFRPHSRHKNLFRNAKRITWLRDPIKRMWSQLNHTLDVKNNDKVFDFVNSRCLKHGITDREAIFKTLLKIPESKRFFNVYERDYSNFSRQFFHFVGNTDCYAEDLQRLSEFMRKPLTTQALNSSKNKQPAPQLNDKERAYFSEEYRIFERLTG